MSGTIYKIIYKAESHYKDKENTNIIQYPYSISFTNE